MPVLALLLASCGAAHLHYLSTPMSHVVDAPATSCGETLNGVTVRAIPPATCPDLVAVELEAARVVRLTHNLGSNDFTLDRAAIVFTVEALDCGTDDGGRNRYMQGCTVPAMALSAVQTDGPLEWGREYQTAGHELMHTALARLGVDDYSDPNGRHYPRTIWSRVDGVDDGDLESGAH